jgi:ABC-type transporter MlaC component
MSSVIDTAVQELIEDLKKIQNSIESDVAKRTGTARRKVVATLNMDGKTGVVFGPDETLAVFELDVDKQKNKITYKIDYTR